MRSNQKCVYVQGSCEFNCKSERGCSRECSRLMVLPKQVISRIAREDESRVTP